MKNINKIILEIVSGNKISYIKVNSYKEAKDYIAKHCPECKLWTIKG